ncbi:conserved protein of unknown function [Shewanella benthica]|uniref:Uncharacterized protein n=1 Tax=Shewanella benthica TaxID=43661 RepID=A0A330M4A3_9GAMM|nr:conserved protein of unknown function [Shewanella benthica]
MVEVDFVTTTRSILPMFTTVELDNEFCIEDIAETGKEMPAKSVSIVTEKNSRIGK